MNNHTISLTIDIKYSRIRIHKYGIHLIRDPSHIQLLVSPTKRNIVIGPKTKDTPHLQTIKLKKISQIKEKSVEIYSNSLCETLLNTIGIEEKNFSYRITGCYLTKENVLLFPFDNIKKIEC